jgi:hypothetical protein
MWRAKHESRIAVKSLISIHAAVANYELSRIRFLHYRIVSHE